MVPQILSLLYFLHREQNYWLILSVVFTSVTPLSLVLHAQNPQYTVYAGMVFFLCFNI